MDLGAQSAEARAVLLNEDSHQVMQRMNLLYSSGKIPKKNAFARLTGFHLDRYVESIGKFVTI